MNVVGVRGVRVWIGREGRRAPNMCGFVCCVRGRWRGGVVVVWGVGWGWDWGFVADVVIGEVYFFGECWGRVWGLWLVLGDEIG